MNKNKRQKLILSSRRNDKLAIAGAMISTGLIHSSALKNNLVADSWVFVYPRSFIEILGYFFKSIIPPEWKSLWLRPIPMFFFWLDNLLWPGTAWGPHLTNIIFHVVNVYLIWLLVRFMQSGTNNLKAGSYGGLPALVACLVYGLHPLTVGSVSWVAARFDVMSVTFGLAGLLMWLRRDAILSGMRGLLGAALVLLVSLLSKEQGIVFIMACFIVSFMRLFSREKKQRDNRSGLIVLGLLVGFYILYRLFIFSGLGGYLTSRHGLNFLVPVYYLCAVIFPFMNSMSGWTFSWTFAVSVLILLALVPIMWSAGDKSKIRIQRKYQLTAGSIFIVGLITTAPHAGMPLEQIMDHAESRFALIPIVGLSLLTGIFVRVCIGTPRIRRAVLVLTLMLGTAAAWRTEVQLQAWNLAGLVADSIIKQTLKIAPDPPPNSKLIFIDIPRNTDQYAYIFGIGLEEALKYKYNGREDLTVIRYPKRRDLGTAQPERDFVFQYHKSNGWLEKLTGVRKKEKKAE